MTKRIFADIIVLFVNNCKLTRGDCDLLSIMMNRNNEIVPTDNNTIISGESIRLPVSEYENISKNEVIVIARVIVPLISKLLVLPMFLLSLAILLSE